MFSVAHRVLKIEWGQAWKALRNVMQVNRNFIKNDNMPSGSKLIYSLPSAHYFINSYIAIVPIGSAYLIYSVAHYKKRLLSLTDEDFRGNNFVRKPHEYYVFLGFMILLIVISIKITHDWPIRIYRQPNNQYTALFINKLSPLHVTKYQFEEAAKAKTWKLGLWHESKYTLDNKKIAGIFDHYIEPPIEYFQMLTPKNLRKPR